MKWIVRAVLALSCFAIYGLYQDHFDNGFYFDDHHTIVNNQSIRSLDNWTSFFADPATFSSLPKNRAYRPVTTLLNAIDYNKTGQLTPASFHWTNFGAYILLVIGVFVLARQLLKHIVQPRAVDLLSLMAAVVFGFNATNAESVNYIIARSDIVASLCIVWALVLYNIESTRKFHLYLLPFLIGLYTKQTGLIFIPLAVMMDAIFMQKSGNLIQRELKAMKRSWLLIIVGCGAFVFNMTFMTPKTTVSHNPDVSQVDYILSQMYVSFHYVKQMIWPSGLVADTDIVVSWAISGQRLMIGLCFTAAMAIWLLVSLIKDWKLVSFGLSWFYFALAPTSLVPLFQVANDHRIQFALIGLVLAGIGQLAVIALAIKQKPKVLTSSFALATGAALLIYLIPHMDFTKERVKVWSSSETLWKDVTIKSPRNGRGFMNYGLALMEQGRLPEAEVAYSRALVVLPGFSYTYINMGILQGLMGKDHLAVRYFEQAIRMDPNNPDCYYYLARYYYERQYFAKARGLLEKGMEISPNYGLITELLPKVYEQMESVRQQWSYSIETQIARIQENPSIDNWLDLSLMYYKSADFEQCIEACQQVLQLDPENKTAYNNICTSYNHMRNWEQAIEACNKALKIDPDYDLAKGNLAEAHLGKGSRVKSLP